MEVLWMKYELQLSTAAASESRARAFMWRTLSQKSVASKLYARRVFHIRPRNVFCEASLEDGNYWTCRKIGMTN